MVILAYNGKACNNKHVQTRFVWNRCATGVCIVTLQQLKYICAVSEYKSIREAAKNLYISQPAISTLIQNLEEELHIRIFEKTGKGITVTPEGKKLIQYATRMIECENELREEFHCENRGSGDFFFSVSSQHFFFNIYAFCKTVQRFSKDRYEVRLRETTTASLLRDVAARKSELGVFSLNHASKKQLGQYMKALGLEFHVIQTRKPYVFLWESHPLAGRASISLSDLAPYPYIQYDQEDDPLHLFSEEPIFKNYNPQKVIVTSDLMMTYHAWKELNAYDLGTGILFPGTGREIVTIPLEEDELYDLGYVTVQNATLSAAAAYMIEQIKSCLLESDCPQNC